MNHKHLDNVQKLLVLKRKKSLNRRGCFERFFVCRWNFADTRTMQLAMNASFYSNFRYTFRLNCFTNDMSRVFSSHHENYWWHRKCFSSSRIVGNRKSHTHIVTGKNFSSFRSFGSSQRRRCRTGFLIGNLCDYFILLDWCFNSMRFLHCGETEAWSVFCIARLGMPPWATLSRKNRTVSFSFLKLSNWNNFQIEEVEDKLWVMGGKIQS